MVTYILQLWVYTRKTFITYSPGVWVIGDVVYLAYILTLVIYAHKYLQQWPQVFLKGNIITLGLGEIFTEKFIIFCKLFPFYETKLWPLCTKT